MKHAPPVMGEGEDEDEDEDEDEEDEEDLVAHGGRDEEFDGGDLADVVLEESPPRG